MVPLCFGSPPLEDDDDDEEGALSFALLELELFSADESLVDRRGLLLLLLVRDKTGIKRFVLVEIIFYIKALKILIYSNSKNQKACITLTCYSASSIRYFA